MGLWFVVGDDIMGDWCCCGLMLPWVISEWNMLLNLFWPRKLYVPMRLREVVMPCIHPGDARVICFLSCGDGQCFGGVEIFLW